MAHILGVRLSTEEFVEVALARIFGIGNNLSKQICYKLGIGNDIRVYDLTHQDITKITKYIEKNFLIETSLRRDKHEYINRLYKIKCRRGIRYFLGLPTRGQRTKTNANTAKICNRM
jgi:small subunit ribosomal protein S13